MFQRETKCTWYEGKSRNVVLLELAVNTTTTTSNLSLDNSMLPSKGKMVLSAELERFRPRTQA